MTHLDELFMVWWIYNEYAKMPWTTNKLKAKVAELACGVSEIEQPAEIF